MGPFAFIGEWLTLEYSFHSNSRYSNISLVTHGRMDVVHNGKRSAKIMDVYLFIFGGPSLSEPESEATKHCASLRTSFSDTTEISMQETPSGKGFQEMAEDELFCERPAKMANFRLAFDTRTKKILDGSASGRPGFRALNIAIGLLRCTAA
jgi:hypothetical protein